MLIFSINSPQTTTQLSSHYLNVQLLLPTFKGGLFNINSYLPNLTKRNNLNEVACSILTGANIIDILYFYSIAKLQIHEHRNVVCERNAYNGFLGIKPKIHISFIKKFNLV